MSFETVNPVLIKETSLDVLEFSEDKAKKLIQERKYLEAIEILKALKFE